MSFLQKPILQEITVPAETEFLGNDIEIIARIQLRATDDRPRLPEETERFYVLKHVIGSNAGTFGLGVLLGDSELKWLGVAGNLGQIPAHRCWGTVEIGRVGLVVSVAVFNRHHLTPKAVKRLKRMLRKIQVELDLPDPSRTVNVNVYTVVQNSTEGELPGGIPRVLACLDEATKRVRVLGLIYPTEPRVIRYPLAFSINADSSAVITKVLKKKPETVFTADDLQCELVQTSAKNVRSILRTVSARSPLLLPHTRNKRKGYMLFCSEVEAYAVRNLDTNPLALLVYAPVRQ